MQATSGISVWEAVKQIVEGCEMVARLPKEQVLGTMKIHAAVCPVGGEVAVRAI